MVKQTVTIRDIARMAGVSAGTVSRALNNSPLVREETRQKILQVVRALNYVPNRAAQRLATGKTLTLAVIVPFFTAPSVVERLKGVVHTLAQSRYDLIIHNIEDPEQRAGCFQTILRRDLVDGVLVISIAPKDEEVRLLSEADVPVVLIDAYHPALTGLLHQITVDDVAGGRAVTEYLIGLGHTKIGFVGDPADNPFNFTSSRDRARGYREALEAAGIPYRPEYYAEGPHGRRYARESARRLLALPDRPTAIFAASDVQAVGVLEAARELGLRVPQDLSVVGYDDVEIAEIVGLTTMRQRLFESGQRGVELLLRTLADPTTKPVHEVLPTELVVRETTGPPP
ncbi:MAG: LacI family transcriptional regulator [Anaerolineae bacterium]|nr:LacI family transcriptional regulator [Anaerolineae bacterium]